MLVISRRKGQSVMIGDEIELVVTELHKSTVKLGIRAPRGLAVLRGEIRETIEQANRAAAASSIEAAAELAEALPKEDGARAVTLDITLRRRPKSASLPRAEREERAPPAPDDAGARRSGG